MPNFTPISPSVFTFVSPTGESPMWKHDYIRPMAKTFIHSPYSFMPPGYATGFLSTITQYPLPTGQLAEYARAAADMVFCHMHKQGLASGMGRYHNGSYDGGFYLQNWGSYTGVIGYDICTLVGHPKDRILNFTYPVRGLSGISPASLNNRSDYGGITGTVNDYSFFIASGITECKMYIEFFADSLKSKLDASGMCYPKYAFWDLEDYLDSRCVHSYNSVSGQVGNYRNAQLDPRYSTETIYYDRIGTTGLSPVTFSGWFTTVTGMLNTSADILVAANSGVVNKFATASLRNFEYGLYKSVYEPLKERFPNILCGNYGIVQTSGRYPSPDSYPIRYYTTQDWLIQEIPFILGDYSSHELYPADSTTNSALPQYMLANEKNEDFTVRIASGHINSMILGAVTGNKAVIPWVSLPNVGENIGTSGLHLQIYDLCRRANIDTLILFNPVVHPNHAIKMIEDSKAYTKYQVSGYQGLY